MSQTKKPENLESSQQDKNKKSVRVNLEDLSPEKLLEVLICWRNMKRRFGRTIADANKGLMNVN